MNLIKRNVLFLLGFVFIIGLFTVLYKIYIPRVNAFGCFDDCFNYLGGYFLTQGKTIYSDFFYNHQPGMAYISALIQIISNPQSIPELVLIHRQFILVFSLISTLALYLRFRYSILVAAVIYEPFKFYVFGDRFLAESILGYLLIYIVGVILESYNHRVLKIDHILAPFFSSLVILLREPFVPVTLLLFAFYFVKACANLRQRVISLLIFLTPLLIHLTYDPYWYFLNLVTINKLVINLGTDASPLVSVLISFFYPQYQLFANEPFHYFRIVLATCSVIFMILLIINSKLESKLTATIFLLLVTFFVNIRPSLASQSFFETFHIAPWFLMVSFIIGFIFVRIIKTWRNPGLVILIIFLLILTSLILSKDYFGREKVNTQNEFFTNYSTVMDTGTTIRNLSNPSDTLFVDGYDDLIIWESKLDSSYKYNWYTSYMPKVDIYKNERMKMFTTSPPDFYYGYCMNSLKGQDDKVSNILKKNYIQINPENDSSCILIHKDKVKSIESTKIKKLEGTKYRINNQDI